MLLYIICGVVIVAGILMILFPKLTFEKHGIIYKEPEPTQIFATRVMGVVVIILCIYYMMIDM